MHAPSCAYEKGLSADQDLFATLGNLNRRRNLLSCSIVKEEMSGGVLGPMTLVEARSRKGSWQKLSTSLLCNHETLPEDRDSSLGRSRMQGTHELNAVVDQYF